MKVFLKWFIGSILLFFVMTFLPVLISDHSRPHYLEGSIFILIGSLVLASLFYYLQVRFVPYRKGKLINKLIEVFGAYPIDDSTTRFNVGNLTIYIQVNIQLLLSEHHSYTETIQFHVPREQIDRLPTKPSFNLKENYCGGVQTYLVYEASSWRLKQAKRKLEKKVGEILNLPLIYVFCNRGRSARFQRQNGYFTQGIRLKLQNENIYAAFSSLPLAAGANWQLVQQRIRTLMP